MLWKYDHINKGQNSVESCWLLKGYREFDKLFLEMLRYINFSVCCSFFLNARRAYITFSYGILGNFCRTRNEEGVGDGGNQTGRSFLTIAGLTGFFNYIQGAKVITIGTV